MNPFRPPPTHRKKALICTLALISTLILTHCEDPERETQLRWREEEVNAKEVAMLRKEREILAERERIQQRELEIAALQSELEKRNAEVALEVEKMKAARRDFEIKNLRGSAPKITAGRAIVIDPESGEVLYEHNPDQKAPIASTQKLLTALLVIERGDLDDIVTI